MIKIPERPEDVKQEHRDYIATEIMGFKISRNCNNLEQWIDVKTGFIKTANFGSSFNPFENIEHTKMVEDKFFNKHDELWIMILNNSPDFTAILYEKDFQTDIKTQEYDEAFVRMTTTLKAHQKLEAKDE